MLVLLGLTIVVFPLVGGLALTCRPSWYQPVSIDYTLLEEDKRAQLRLENEISAALNSNRAIVIELEQAQVYRWIAARHELWPAEAPSLEPFERPQIVFLDGNRVRLGALVSHSGMRVVLSTTFHVELQPEAVVVTWGAVHAGALPTPQLLIEQSAQRAADRLDLYQEAVTDGRVALPVEGTWPNGKRRVRITDLSIHDGRARLRLEPL
jgi:hypothetical protein